MQRGQLAQALLGHIARVAGRQEGVRFATDGALLPADDAVLMQGFVEGSNVDAIREIARMIEVQRAYELGTTFLDREDERVRGAIRVIGQ